MLVSLIGLASTSSAVPSRNEPSNDRWTQDIARRRRIRKGIRLLKRKINRAIHSERENAIIYRLLATRFPSGSNEAALLRSLGGRAMRRVRRLKGPLTELHEIWRPARRTWCFYVRCLSALYAPRRFLCRREERKSKTGCSCISRWLRCSYDSKDMPLNTISTISDS